MKDKSKRIVHIAMLVVCAFVLLTFPFQIVNGSKTVSIIENRALADIPSFSFPGFASGEYQSQLESSLADQFAGSDRFKAAYNSFLIDEFRRITAPYYYYYGDDSNQDRYRKVSRSFYVYDHGDNLIPFPRRNFVPEYSDYQEVLDGLNQAVPDSLEKFVYFAETPDVIDFNHENPHVMREFLADSLPGYTVGALEFEDYDEYDKLFYKTDHHWNYLGSYRGYGEIMNMMGVGSSELLAPLEYKEFDIYDFGSYAKKDSYYKIKTKFGAYIFDYPEHSTWINGEIGNYGGQQLFLDGGYSIENVNRYPEFYGNDYAEVIFDYGNADAENILIIKNSLGNAVLPLIAAHFNKTYCIDLRHYENFDIDAYVKEHNITKFVCIFHIWQLSDSTFVIGRTE
jgi:hypothetical protein